MPEELDNIIKDRAYSSVTQLPQLNSLSYTQLTLLEEMSGSERNPAEQTKRRSDVEVFQMRSVSLKDERVSLASNPRGGSVYQKGMQIDS